MYQDDMNQDPNTSGMYQDPIAASNGKPVKQKTGGGSTILATVVSIGVFFMFGLIGGLICYGGYWAVYAIAKSRMPLAARIILGTIVAIVFLVLLIVFILFAATIRASI